MIGHKTDMLAELDNRRMSRVLRHRLLNIAAGLRGGLRVLEEEAGDGFDSSLREYLALMQRECDGINEIAARLTLLFGDLPPAESNDAVELSNAVIHSVQRAHSRTEIGFSGFVEKLHVHGNLALALREIIVNACEAAQDGGVKVVLSGSADGVVWRVIDDGGGVAAETECEITVPFFTTRTRHIGVGLPIAQRISRAYGGGLRVVNDRDAPGLMVELWCGRESV